MNLENYWNQLIICFSSSFAYYDRSPVATMNENALRIDNPIHELRILSKKRLFELLSVKNTELSKKDFNNINSFGVEFNWGMCNRSRQLWYRVLLQRTMPMWRECRTFRSKRWWTCRLTEMGGEWYNRRGEKSCTTRPYLHSRGIIL